MDCREYQGRGVELVDCDHNDLAVELSLSKFACTNVRVRLHILAVWLGEVLRPGRDGRMARSHTRQGAGLRSPLHDQRS
jgi:hypothetical protein